MSYTTGTATDHLDLANKLETYLTTTMTPSGERWFTQRKIWEEGYSVTLSDGGWTNLAEAFDSVSTPATRTTFPATIGAQWATAKDVTSFTWTNSASTTYHPKTFTVEYSDNGSTWTTAATFTNVAATSNGSYSWTSVGAHTYWRVNVTVGQSTTLQCGYIQFFGSTYPWVNLLDEYREIILRGVGLAGTDNIYAAIVAYKSTASDYYNWSVYGMSGYVAGNQLSGQPGLTQAHDMCLWNSSMSYWFIANGQRFMVVAKVSTVYESMYVGKFLPYATPSQYPYPVFVGASHYNTGQRWSDVTRGHSAFWNPSGVSVSDTAASVFLPDNTSKQVSNESNSGAGGHDDAGVWPWRYAEAAGTTETAQFDNNPDGSYPLLPSILIVEQPSYAVLGELDGVMFITGFSNASENTVTVGAETFLVVQSTFQTTRDSYAALKLA